MQDGLSRGRTQATLTGKRSLRLLGVLTILAASTALAQTDPLPSWNDGPEAGDRGVRRGYDHAGIAGLRPAAERIATFDNDGTLWSEQPIYFQFALRARPRQGARAAASRSGRRRSRSSLAARGRHEGRRWPAARRRSLEIMAATHAGMTTDEFDADRRATGSRPRKHPKTERPYTEMVYQPMLELLAYLRANGFKTFIVSGGGIEFMRAVGREGLRHPARAGRRQQRRS